jgi:hypothetical protein
MSHKSTAPGIPYRVKPRFKRSPCPALRDACENGPEGVTARFFQDAGDIRWVTGWPLSAPRATWAVK